MDVNGQLHVPVASLQAKEPQYPLDWRLSGSQSRYKHGDEKNLFLAPSGKRTAVI
jgi:hypothetical protein